jgi:hypothetical protein
MDQWWIYASLLLGAGDAAKWAVLAVIASYIIGSMMIGRRQTATVAT